MLAEIYPSLIDPYPGNEVLDARQVKAVVEALRELDRRESWSRISRRRTTCLPMCAMKRERSWECMIRRASGRSPPAVPCDCH